MVNVKNFDAILHREKKGNGFQRSTSRNKYSAMQVGIDYATSRNLNMQKRPEISLKYVCFLQFTDEEQTYFLHNVY